MWFPRGRIKRMQGPSPPQSILPQSRRASRSHSRAHAGGFLGAQQSHTRGPTPEAVVWGRCTPRASSRSSAHPLPAERRPVLPSTALAPTVGTRDGSGGGLVRPPASPLSRPQPSPPFASQAHGQRQDGRGNNRPSPASSLAPSRTYLCPSEGQDRSPCSARGPRGPDPRSPPPPSGSSLRRPPGLCGCPGGCPGSLQLACRLSRPQGSHLGLRARRPGSGGPPPASPGSG